MPAVVKPRTRLASSVDAMLAPGGRLALAWPRFEERAGQRSLAADIADTFERGGVLMAEAPTGIGKSLAYLLPAVLLASEREVRVVIATCTRSLQDQLVDRDLPALCTALATRVRVARLKGKQNYLCPRSLELAESRGADEDEALESLRRWAAGENDGDLDRAPVPDGEAFRRLRSRVAASPTACTLATCRRGRDCPWVRARREAASAQVLIVNHALLARAGEAEGLLPEFDLLVVDEAHRLEGMLVSQLERSASRSRVEELLRVMGTPRATGRGSGLLGRLSAYVAPLLAAGRTELSSDVLDRLAHRAGECRADVERLFSRIEPRATPRSTPRGSPSGSQATNDDRYGARERYRTAGELLAGDLEPLESALDHCRQFARGLHRVAETLDRPGAGSAAIELAAELDQVSGQWAALETDLADLCGAERRDWVYWRASAGRGVEVRGAPIAAGEHVRRLVLSRAKSVVLTSATLSAGGDFTFAAERLGMGETWGVPYEATRVESPFDLPRQMRCFVHGAPDEASGVAELVARLARATGRRQLVLFTAHERLRRARARLQETLPEGTLLLAQEWDGGAGHVAARFRASPGAILLGVQSLWEGVDFPGDELEILVVAKLPFSVPDDPRVEARAERLRDRGLDPFRDDAVPEAVLRFRQGVGRLIRRADDRGVLVVCDPRLLTASYRRPFLEALPEPPVRLDDAAALALEASRFLSGAWAMEDHA